MKKNIAIIIERANIVLGGAERSVFELSLALSSLGNKVTILAAKGQTDAKNIHILCQGTPGKRTDFSTFSKALKEHLSQNHYDIVHSVLPFDFADVYQPRGGSFAESIIRNAASYENKFVETYKRITAIANVRRSIQLRAEKKLCKTADGPIVAALSEYVAEQFRKHYGLDEKRLTVIPNGIKIQKRLDTITSDRLRSQILSKLNLVEANNPVFFLFVANNFRLKGLGPLIKALQIVDRKNSDRPAYLVVAGLGKPHKYRHLARQLKVHKKIIFLGAIRHVQNVLAVADVAVLPTFYDPSSRFILESLAAKRPVITTKFNGASDMFNERHGKIIDTPDNVQALAEALQYFTDTENIENASQAIADDNLEEKISIIRVAKQLQSLYDSIPQKEEQK